MHTNGVKGKTIVHNSSSGPFKHTFNRTLAEYFLKISTERVHGWLSVTCEK